MKISSVVAVFFLFGAILCGCSREPEAVVRQKLDLVLQRDIAAALKDVKPEERLKMPYDTTLEYMQYTEGVYSHRATVEYYLFQNLKVKIARKYRYHSQLKQWECYLNEYRLIHAPLLK
jgi:hypothetical protein